MAAAPHLASIWAVLCNELVRASYWSPHVLSAGDAEQLHYTESSEPLASVIAQLESGAFASLQLHRHVPSAAIIGLYRPNFCDEPFSQWRCLVEGDEQELSRVYGAFRNSSPLSLVSLWVDEAADLDSAVPAAETFPWDDWRLIRASVRIAGGEWLERAGVAQNAFQEGHSGIG